MEQHPCLGFALAVSCAAAAIAIVGWQALLGFVAGVIVSLVAATIAAADSD